jgi:hypothetical protein
MAVDWNGAPRAQASQSQPAWLACERVPALWPWDAFRES